MSEPEAVTVIDTGLGNVASILNMLRTLRVRAERTSDPLRVMNARSIILPGVGAFDAGMTRLDQLGLVEPLRASVLQHRVPLLGICLGMQLLTDSSEEGTKPGLGLVPGQTVRIPIPAIEASRCKLPHMGWNTVSIVRQEGLYAGYMRAPRYYFVHSYHVMPQDTRHITATAQHGSTTVTASIQRGTIFGVQFHPEKSHRYGQWLMENFLRIAAC